MHSSAICSVGCGALFIQLTSAHTLFGAQRQVGVDLLLILVRQSLSDSEKKVLETRKGDISIGMTGEKILILQKPDLKQLRIDLQAVFATGIRALAVSLMHSCEFSLYQGNQSRKEKLVQSSFEPLFLCGGVCSNFAPSNTVKTLTAKLLVRGIAFVASALGS